MSTKKRKNYSQEFKVEAVRLLTGKGYSIVEASRNLSIEYTVLRRWKDQFPRVPGKGALRTSDEELRKL